MAEAGAVPVVGWGVSFLGRILTEERGPDGGELILMSPVDVAVNFADGVVIAARSPSGGHRNSIEIRDIVRAGAFGPGAQADIPGREGKAMVQILVVAVTIVCATIARPVHAESNACPSYTKMQALEGTPSDLPRGFFIFYRPDKSGVYISPVNPFRPSVIPNTGGDNPRSLDISEDGEWIFYIAESGETGYIIRRNGDAKTRVPTNHASGGFPKVGGFYRRSPRGEEIYYMASESRLVAVQVTLGASGASFGDQRTIVDLGWGMSFAPPFGTQVLVSGDQVLGRVDFQSSISGEYVGRTSYITIPNGGRGKAGANDLFQWANDKEEAVWGCGHAMSADGDHCLANSSLIGSAPCVPNRKCEPMMDHKGVYITPFRRDTDPAIEIDDGVDKYGTSINWCPERYRFGDYNEVDFTCWSFTNSPDFFVGSLKGTKAPHFGIWLVHWKTNTWTLLTPEQSDYALIDPVLYFHDIDGNLSPRGLRRTPETGSLGWAGRRLLVPSSAQRVEIYTTSGRLLWRYAPTHTGSAHSLELPRHIRGLTPALIPHAPRR